MFDLIVKFASVSILLTVLPGPNTLLVARNALAGRALAAIAAVGTAAGALTWGVAAAVGLAAILERSNHLYQAVKLAGAAYLVVLGVMTIWSTVRRRRHPGGPAPEPERRPVPAPPPTTRAAAFRAGFISDVLNPKTGIFYVAIVPQLLPAHIPVLAGTMLFSAVDAVVTTTWFTVLGLFVARLAALYSQRVLRVAERVTGVFLIGLGLRAATDS